MYIIVRCSGCGGVLVGSDTQQWLLCPACGLTFPHAEARVFLKCRDRDIADNIAVQLRPILRERRGHDLSDDEILLLQEKFIQWNQENGYR